MDLTRRDLVKFGTATAAGMASSQLVGCSGASKSNNAEETQQVSESNDTRPQRNGGPIKRSKPIDTRGQSQALSQAASAKFDAVKTEFNNIAKKQTYSDQEFQGLMMTIGDFAFEKMFENDNKAMFNKTLYTEALKDTFAKLNSVLSYMKTSNAGKQKPELVNKLYNVFKAELSDDNNKWITPTIFAESVSTDISQKIQDKAFRDSVIRQYNLELKSPN